MASVLDLVKYYQRAIEKYPQDEKKILSCIDHLFNLAVTVQHLQDTGVGRTVNALRKEPGEVGQAARSLVHKWKLMVASEESDQEGDHSNDTSKYNGYDKYSDDAANQSRNKHVKEERSSSSSNPSTTEKEHRHMNGNSNSSKRKYQSSEEEEPESKRNKYSSPSDDEHYKTKPDIKIKKETSETDSEDSDNSHSDDSYTESSESSDDINKVKIKTEPSDDKHKSSSLKLSSSSSQVDLKVDSSNLKRSYKSSEEYSKHNENVEPKSSSSKSKEKSYKDSKEDMSAHKKHKTDHSGTDKERKDKSKSSSKHTSSDKHHNKSVKHNSSEKHYKTSNKLHSSSDKHSDNSERHNNSTLDKQDSDKYHSSEMSYSSSNKDHSNSEKHNKSEHDKSSEKDKTNKKSHSEKHVSKSEKSHSSHTHKSNQEKHKKNSEVEVSNNDKDDSKHKSKHSKRDNSTEKHTLSNKEKSKKDHSRSSKEKSEKKSHSSDISKSKGENKKCSNKDDRSSEKKSKDKLGTSSSSPKTDKSSSNKSKDIPKKKTHGNSEDSEDGIDCGSGASFAEALGMVIPSKPKKKSSTVKDTVSPSNSLNSDMSPATLLAPTAKLAPLPAIEISALPDISPNYKPRPPPKPLPHFTDDEAMNQVISSKNQRTKVYSGNKIIGKIPTLYEMCVQVLQEHIDALEYTGGVPYEILKPVVDKATPQQLFMLEHYNPYLMEDTNHLWQKFCEKHFRKQQRQELETWREMFMRCQDEQESKLKSLTENIKIAQEAKKAPIKQTKMAYVDSIVKPPRNIARKQAIHGTARAATASPAARVAALAAAPNVLRGGAVRPANSAPVSLSTINKPKKAPLMQKALQFMRGRKR